MASYLLHRLTGTLPVLLLISLLVFLLIHAAPGDPTLLLLGEETNAAEVARAKERWGLDRPLYVQYLKFLNSAVAGDFGKSFKSFRALVITPSDKRLQHMREAVSNFPFSPPQAKRFIWGTTDEKATKQLLFESIWQSMDTKDETIYKIG